MDRKKTSRMYRRKWRALALVVAFLLLISILFQVVVDRTPAGSGQRSGNFPSAASLARFMGGIRQYFAYTFFIKTDKLYHLYGSNPEAIPYFILITYLDPHYVDAYYVASGLIYDAGRHQEALDLILRGIRANPDSGDLYFSLAIWYLDEGCYQEAREAFEKTLQLRQSITSRHTAVRGLVAVYKKLGETVNMKKPFLEMIAYNRLRLMDEDLIPEERRALLGRVNGYCDEVLPEGQGGP